MAERGQRDTRGDETRHQDQRDEEHRSAGGTDPGVEGVTDQHPDPTARVA